jgi:hypothetical protein
MKEFEQITTLKDSIRFHKILFPRNCLTWIGASLLANFDKISFKYVGITKEEYEGNHDVLNKLLK